MSGGPRGSRQRALPGLDGGSRSVLKVGLGDRLFLWRWQRLLLSNLRHATELRSQSDAPLRMICTLTARLVRASSVAERRYIQTPSRYRPCMAVISYTRGARQCDSTGDGGRDYLDFAKLALITGALGDGLFGPDSAGRSGT